MYDNIMPTLPTFEVTQAQADRLINAFGSVDNYKAWLKERLIEYVIESEARQEYLNWQATQNNKGDQTRQELDI